MATNVLLILADDMNYNTIGCFGCPVDNISPNLDKLASEGIRFDNAHVSIAVCQPSRQCIMTGLYPHHNGALGFDPIREDVTTLTEVLRSHGYYNGIIGHQNISLHGIISRIPIMHKTVLEEVHTSMKRMQQNFLKMQNRRENHFS